MSRKKLLSSSTTTAATATASKHRRLERRLFFRSCHLPFYSRTLFSVPTAATAGASAGASVVGAAASATGGTAAMTTSSAVIGRRRWRKKKRWGRSGPSAWASSVVRDRWSASELQTCSRTRAGGAVAEARLETLRTKDARWGGREEERKEVKEKEKSSSDERSSISASLRSESVGKNTFVLQPINHARDAASPRSRGPLARAGLEQRRANHSQQRSRSANCPSLVL